MFLSYSEDGFEKSKKNAATFTVLRSPGEFYHVFSLFLVQSLISCKQLSHCLLAVREPISYVPAAPYQAYAPSLPWGLNLVLAQ